MIDPDDKQDIESDFLELPDEQESDIDAIESEDFDDESEDGIFAPGEETSKKKKSTLKLTALIVVLALLCGGAFYFYTQGAEITAPPAARPAIVANNTSPPVSDQAPVPGVPTPASDFAPETPAVPVENAASDLSSVQPVTLDQSGAAPAPDAITAESPMPQLPEPAEDAGTSVSEVGSDNANSAPQISDKQIPMPPERDPDAAGSPPEPAMTDASQPPADTNIPLAMPMNVGRTEEATPPDTSVLTPVAAEPAPAPAKKNELEAARETINVAKDDPVKEKTQKTVYFDAPNGKALTDIPPPSIDPMREPGQSIIIVKKAGTKDENVRVEKGDDTAFIESRLVNAKRASKLGMNDAALEFYNELYKKNPRDPRILMGRAVTLQKMGETQKAIEGYQEVLEVQGDNPEAITNLMGLMGKTQPAVALQNLLELREKYPNNASVAAQLGVAYAQSGNPQDGLKYLNIAAGIQPENPMHFYNMAVVFEQLKDRPKAIEYYEKTLDTYAVYGEGAKMSFSREQIYDRLATLRGS